jgi:hypothetical protein
VAATLKVVASRVVRRSAFKPRLDVRMTPLADETSTERSGDLFTWIERVSLRHLTS